MDSTLKPNRNRIFAVISVALGLLVALLVAEWGLDIYFQRTQSQSMEPGFMRYHPQLGWSLSPGWSGEHRHFDYQATYHLDPSGFRLQPASSGAESRQFAVLGDSFTFGLGVQDDETFTALLNARGEGEYLNYGVPGTSTDQHLLLLNQIIRRGSPDAVLLMIYLPNDILDSTLEYPLQAEQAKPVFRLNGDELELGNVPVPRAAKPARLRSTTMGSIILNGFDAEDGMLMGTQIGRMVDTVLGGRAYDMVELRPALARNLEPALSLFAALLNEVAEVARDSGIGLTVALLPGRDAVINAQGISHHYQEYLREEILSMTSDTDITAIDLMSELVAQPSTDLQRFYFPNDGHLTPAGHQFVAATLARLLSD